MAHMDTEQGKGTSRGNVSGSPGTLSGTYRGEESSSQMSGSRTEHEARQTAGEMKHEAERLTQEAKQRGQALFEGQRQAAADEIGGMVNALRKTAHDLENEHRDATARLAYRGADFLDRFAGTLRERDMRSLFNQAESYARQHPGVFFGGSVIAGLLLARFLKSSADSQGYRGGLSTSSRHRSSAGSDYVF